MPSFSPISPPRLLPWAHSETKKQPPTLASSLRKGTKSASNEVRQAVNGYYFWSDTLETSTMDHHLTKSLKHLISLKTINNKDITNPYLFRGAPMVTTFVRSAGNRTTKLWRFLEEASQTDIRLAELEHPSLKRLLHQCTGRVPIYVHLSFYRSQKLRYPMDVGGSSRDGRVTFELGSGPPV